MTTRDSELLSLVPEDVKLTKANSVTFKLRVTPEDVNSATYDKTVMVLSGGEGIRSVLTWMSESVTVMSGMAATTGPAMQSVVQ